MASIMYVIDLYIVLETQKGTSYRDFLMMHYGLDGRGGDNYQILEF